MMKDGAKKLLSTLLSVSLVAGNMGDFQVYAKEEAVSVERIEQILEPAGGVQPTQIQLISEEEALELQKVFDTIEMYGLEGVYSEPDINSVYGSCYGYNTLETAQQQACYSELKAAAYTFHEEFNESVKKTTSSGNVFYIWEDFNLEQYNFTDSVQLQQVLFALEADCPELFWLTGNFTWSINSRNVITYFYPAVSEDYATVESRQTAQESIDEGISSYLEAIDGAKAQGKNDMQIELLIHDKILQAIDYAYDSDGNPEDAGYAHSIVGVLDGAGAVCEGYAKAFQLLANYAGLESIYAVGYGDGGGHAWNLVCLDGEWYNLDITWNDEGEKEYCEGVRHLYYNCNTTTFGNHEYVPSVFPGMYQVPETTADTYNYYKYYNLYVTEENVADEDAFATFFENAVNGCKERNDYLLQFYSEDSTVHSGLVEMISQNAYSVLADVNDNQRVYKNPGKYYQTTTNGYVVYYPMACIYADNYEAAYSETGAELDIHVVNGRNEVAQEGNYTVSYSGNQQPGTAKAVISGLGDYEFLGTSELEFSVLDTGEVMVTPTITLSPTATASPTKTEEPDNTPTPTALVTVTAQPSATPQPTKAEDISVTPEPEVTAEPSVTPEPEVTPEPSVTKEPEVTIEPSVTKEPEVTVEPSVTQKPEVTTEPSVTLKPEVTSEPSVTKEPEVTSEPSVTKEPEVTPEPSVTPKPKVTLVAYVTPNPTKPNVSVTPEPSQSADKEDSTPSQVTGVKFVSATNAKVTVSFAKQQGVSGYEIVLMKGNRQVKSVVTTKNKYTFQKLSAGTDYKVKVRAFVKKANQKIYGNYSKTIKAATATKAPSIRQVKRKKNQAVVQWKKVKNASGYEIYMSGKKNKGYKKIATITKGTTVKYTKKKLNTEKPYYFKIRTYRKVGGKKVYSSYSKAVKCK